MRRNVFILAPDSGTSSNVSPEGLVLEALREKVKMGKSKTSWPCARRVSFPSSDDSDDRKNCVIDYDFVFLPQKPRGGSVAQDLSPIPLPRNWCAISALSRLADGVLLVVHVNELHCFLEEYAKNEGQQGKFAFETDAPKGENSQKKKKLRRSLAFTIKQLLAEGLQITIFFDGLEDLLSPSSSCYGRSPASTQSTGGNGERGGSNEEEEDFYIETAYQEMSALIEGINDLISISFSTAFTTTTGASSDGAFHPTGTTTKGSNSWNGVQLLDPKRGHNICFGSTLEGWAFTLPQFSTLYNKRRTKDERSIASATAATGGGDQAVVDKREDTILERFWGDHFYCKEKRTWGRGETPILGRRGFSAFCLDPLIQIYKTVQEVLTEELVGGNSSGERVSGGGGDDETIAKQKLKNILSTLDIQLIGAPKDAAEILRAFLPINEALLHQTLFRGIPSPEDSQKFRTSRFWFSGKSTSSDSSSTVLSPTYSSTENCDPKGPLAGFISYIFPILGGGGGGGDAVPLDSISTTTTAGGRANEMPVSSAVTTPPHETGSFRLLSLGRVYSGSVRCSQDEVSRKELLKLDIFGQGYIEGKKDDVFINKSISGWYTLARDGLCETTAEGTSAVEAGSLIILESVHHYLHGGGGSFFSSSSTLKPKTETTAVSLHSLPFRPLRFRTPNSLEFAVTATIQFKTSPSSSPPSSDAIRTLVEALKIAAKLQPQILPSVSWNNDYPMIRGGTEAELQQSFGCVREIMKFKNESSSSLTESIATTTIVPQVALGPVLPVLRETVDLVPGGYSIECMTKTPNKHNRLWMKSQSLDSGLVEEMEESFGNGVNDPDSFLKMKKDEGNATSSSSKTPSLLAKFEKNLEKKFTWKTRKSIWAFGNGLQSGFPEDPPFYGVSKFNQSSANILVETLPRVIGREEIASVKDSFLAGWRWASREGPICEQSLRGVQINFSDAVLHADARRRGAGQIIPTARKAIYASILAGNPRLLEPILACDVLVRTTCSSNRDYSQHTVEQHHRRHERRVAAAYKVLVPRQASFITEEHAHRKARAINRRTPYHPSWKETVAFFSTIIHVNLLASECCGLEEALTKSIPNDNLFTDQVLGGTSPSTTEQGQDHYHEQHESLPSGGSAAILLGASFKEWSFVNGSIAEEGTQAHTIAKALRRERGSKLDIPGVSSFVDETRGGDPTVTLSKEVFASLQPYTVENLPAGQPPFHHDLLEVIFPFLPFDFGTMVSVSAVCRSWRYLAAYLPHWQYVRYAQGGKGVYYTTAAETAIKEKNVEKLDINCLKVYSPGQTRSLILRTALN